jgi:hypothetical protein
MYLLEANDDVRPFLGRLPLGIQAGDDLKAVIARLGEPPSKEVFAPGDDSGYAIWENRMPIVHVLFSMADAQVPLRVNVFLPPSSSPI